MKIPVPNVRKRARIEIIPLIDIIFFLLATFVMVSLSMVKLQGIKVDLPVVSTGAKQDIPEFVVISVSQDGVLYIDKEPVTKDGLEARLKQLKMTKPDITLLISGDSKAFFGDAIVVLDEIRRLGFSKVTIQTQNKTEEGAVVR